MFKGTSGERMKKLLLSYLLFSSIATCYSDEIYLNCKANGYYDDGTKLIPTNLFVSVYIIINDIFISVEGPREYSISGSSKSYVTKDLQTEVIGNGYYDDKNYIVNQKNFDAHTKRLISEYNININRITGTINYSDIYTSAKGVTIILTVSGDCSKTSNSKKF
jgi:hypothetical protein